VAVVGRLVQKRKETAQKEKEYIKQYTNNTEHGMHKIKKNTKQKRNVKRILKKHKSGN